MTPIKQHLQTDKDIFDNTCTQMITSLTTYQMAPAHRWWHLWQPIRQHLYTDDIFDDLPYSSCTGKINLLHYTWNITTLHKLITSPTLSFTLPCIHICAQAHARTHAHTHTISQPSLSRSLSTPQFPQSLVSQWSWQQQNKTKINIKKLRRASSASQSS